MTVETTAYLPGDTVRYFDNGMRAGVVKEITARRSGGHWYHLIIEDGRVKKFGEGELHPSNDMRMQKLRALTPAEAESFRRDYLELAIQRAATLRALYVDQDEKKDEAPKRQAAAADQGTVAKFIEAVKFLKVATKSQILAKIGDLSASMWNKTVAEVLATGQVEVHGKRRGTKYTIPGYKVEQVQPQDDVKVKEYAEKVNGFIFTQGRVEGGWSRAEIMGVFPTSNTTYQAAMKLLVESGKVVKTGAKRGTRYHVA